MNSKTLTFALAVTLAGGSFVMGNAAAAERTATLAVENLWCVSCAYILQSTLADTPGVENVVIADIDRDDVGTTHVTYDDAAVSVGDLIRIANDLGYPATPMGE